MAQETIIKRVGPEKAAQIEHKLKHGTKELTTDVEKMVKKAEEEKQKEQAAVAKRKSEADKNRQSKQRKVAVNDRLGVAPRGGVVGDPGGRCPLHLWKHNAVKRPQGNCTYCNDGHWRKECPLLTGVELPPGHHERYNGGAGGRGGGVVGRGGGAVAAPRGYN
jgi:hypothetical protein